MFDLPVPCLIRSDSLRRRVGEALTASGLQTRFLLSHKELAWVPEEVGVFVVEDRLHSQTPVRRTVRGFMRDNPSVRLLVLVELLGLCLEQWPLSTAEFCVVATDLLALPKRIAWARFDAWKERVEKRIRNTPVSPWPCSRRS